MNIKELEQKKAEIERQIAAQRKPYEDTMVIRIYKDTRTAAEVQRSIKELEQTIAGIKKDIKRNILLSEPKRNEYLYTQIDNWEEFLERDYAHLALIQAEEAKELEKYVEAAKAKGMFNVRIQNGRVVYEETQRIPLNYEEA